MQKALAKKCSRAAATSVEPSVLPKSSIHRDMVPRSSERPSRRYCSCCRCSGIPSQYFATAMCAYRDGAAKLRWNVCGGIGAVTMVYLEAVGSSFARGFSSRYFTRATTTRTKPPLRQRTSQASSKPMRGTVPSRVASGSSMRTSGKSC